MEQDGRGHDQEGVGEGLRAVAEGDCQPRDEDHARHRRVGKVEPVTELEHLERRDALRQRHVAMEHRRGEPDRGIVGRLARGDREEDREQARGERRRPQATVARTAAEQPAEERRADGQARRGQRSRAP